MSEYHKINSIYKRDMANGKQLIEGQWSQPEFEYLGNNEWEFSEKIDSTNVRIILPPEGPIVFGGRTDNAQMPTPLISRLAQLFGDGTQLRTEFPGGVILYGEGYGGKIQSPMGGKYGANQDFILFDVRVGHWWLEREAVAGIATRLGLQVVPLLGRGTLHDAVAMAKAGIKSTFGDFQAEGIVARPTVGLLTRGGHRLIAKIKCRDFQRIGGKQ